MLRRSTPTGWAADPELLLRVRYLDVVRRPSTHLLAEGRISSRREPRPAVCQRGSTRWRPRRRPSSRDRTLGPVRGFLRPAGLVGAGAGADGASATALQPPPHLLTTLPAPAGGGRCGSPGRGLRGAPDQGTGETRRSGCRPGVRRGRSGAADLAAVLATQPATGRAARGRGVESERGALEDGRLVAGDAEERVSALRGPPSTTRPTATGVQGCPAGRPPATPGGAAVVLERARRSRRRGRQGARSSSRAAASV